MIRESGRGDRTAHSIHVADEVAAIVRPGVLVFDDVAVVDRDARLDEPLAQAAESARAAAEAADVTAAVRAMYRRVGHRPDEDSAFV